MAIQILPKTGLGERLGSAVGTGLSSGLQGLLQSKIGEIERQKGIQQTQSGLQSLGLSPSIASLPENLQQIVAKQALQQPGQQAYANALSSLLGANTAQQEEGTPPNLSGLNQPQINELTKLGLQKQKMLSQQDQFSAKERAAREREFNAETREYRQAIKKTARSNKDDLREIGALEELVKSGKLPNPLYFSLLEATGLDLPSLFSTEANVYQKGVLGHFRNLKDSFGARPTNFDVANFIKTLATLSQTDEGKLEILKLQKTQKQAGILRAEALNDVLRKNKGKEITPDELEEQVEKKSGKKLDRLWDEYTQNINKLTGGAFGNKEDSPPIFEPMPLPGVQSPSDNQPTALGETGRHVGRSVARGIETIANIPGDLASFGLSVADLATLGKLPQISRANKFIGENLNARNVTRALTGEQLEPQNEAERRADEIVSDLATFLLPTAGKVKVIPALVKTALGNTAGFLGEKIGGPVGKTLAKVGSVLLYSFSGGRKALEDIKKQGTQVIDNLAGTVKTTVPQLEKDLGVINRELSRGVKSEGKDFVANAIQNLPGLIEKGKASVKELWNAKVELNQLYGDRNTPADAKKYLVRVVDVINNNINKYGKKNKEFGKAVERVNDIHRGLNQASDIAQTIQKNVKTEKITSPLIKSLLYGSVIKNPSLLPAIGAGAGAAFGIQKFTKFTQLLKNSSEAKKYYKNILKAAAVENPLLIKRNAKKLDEIATKEGY